jgi:diguanylate cyclase (GGDEF)-like protein
MDGKKELKIQSEVNKLLLKESRNTKRLGHKVELLEERFGDDIYPSLLYTTAHMEFSSKTAKKHWKEILCHWRQMCGHVKREIDFRVALLDYFVDVNKRIKNPKIIEIKIFKKTQQETFVDELTQLYNYRHFMNTMNIEIVRANRYKAPLSLVIFDVDDFKHYNDTNGHLAGNKTLKKFAQIIKKSVRNVDVAARFGGEEFALILPETNKEGGMIISDRIRKKVERSTFVKGEKQPLKRFTVSGGVATLNVDASDAPDLIRKADLALYLAKARGKNQIAFYVEETRIFKRVNASIMGRLAVVSDTGDIFEVQDISEGGLLFRFDKPISLGTILNLSLNLPGRKTPIRCKAKVRRVEELQKDKQYNIGVQIIQIRESERKSMKRFIKSKIRKKKNS